jgi:hypothetical protein
LHLLFYLLLPPKTLLAMLENHPAGGVPCWLLEVGNETVLSLASLSHYHLYGDTFLPESSNASNHSGSTKPSSTKSSSSSSSGLLSIHGELAYAFLLSLIVPPPTPEEGGVSLPAAAGGADAKHVTSPVRKNSSIGLKRRGSNHNSQVSLTGILDRVQEMDLEIAEAAAAASEATATRAATTTTTTTTTLAAAEKENADWTASRERFQRAKTTNHMTMTTFYEWTEQALDDVALDAIMNKLFATGILPSPTLELELVTSRWKIWQENEDIFRAQAQPPQGTPLELLTLYVQKLPLLQNGEATPRKHIRKTFGGIGGFDGRGGNGHGVMYCIDKKWWESWEAYVGWTWAGATLSAEQRPQRSRKRHRPDEISTEALLNRLDDGIVAGTLGSYELMKTGLKRDVDYVLIPPGVWDILFEIYGGGPPLPRMVNPPAESAVPGHVTEEGNSASNNGVEVKAAPSATDFDVMASTDYVLRIPNHLSVETHPSILHFHLCDPQQPYRRGEAGPMSIRVMAMPNQPLWRLYAEIIVRLPFQIFRTNASDGRGRARLWKRTDPAGNKDAMSRYGPWVPLCKNRFAILPILNQDTDLEEHYDELKTNWQEYADNASVESIGLMDGDQIMVECAVLNRNGDFMWPREAAAKAGRVRRLADQDMKFRRMLRGLDDNDEKLASSPDLVGMAVDAMDASGRWYQVQIAQVQNVMAETDDEDEDEDESMEMESAEGFGGAGTPANPYNRKDRENGEHKEVQVDFTDHGGHSEWIDVKSDRLATAGRFTMGTSDERPDAQTKDAVNSNDGKAKATAQVKKAVPEAVPENNGKVCTFPGYGACGLANLGNTCYANSAIQCISYLPLLRAYLLSAQYKAIGDLNKDNPLGTGGKILEEFAELLRLMWSAKIGEKSPTRFRGQLGKANSQFSGADQQDAQEFLNYMLDMLHEDSNRVRTKPYVEALEDEWVRRTSLPRVGEEAWRR